MFNRNLVYSQDIPGGLDKPITSWCRSFAMAKLWTDSTNLFGCGFSPDYSTESGNYGEVLRILSTRYTVTVKYNSTTTDVYFLDIVSAL